MSIYEFCSFLKKINKLIPNAEILIGEISHTLDFIEDKPTIRGVIFRGKGNVFCAGADLKSPPGQIADGAKRAVPYADVLTAIMDSPKPVIAAINGAAFAGGLGLVGAADIVITDQDVQFSFSEVRIGVIPAIISVVCLPKLGTHHGMKLIVTGERFNGKRAVEMNFAHGQSSEGVVKHSQDHRACESLHRF